MKRYNIALSFSLLLSAGVIYAQSYVNSENSNVASIDSEQIIIAPLFEYPIAPEDLPDLQSKSDYLMLHFWDKMNFDNKSTVDQNALNDAFLVYTTAIPYASRDVALSSINSLIKKLNTNPTLLIQFTKAAEEMLYGPRAVIWSDEIYFPFLKAITDNKNVSKARKSRYEMQLKTLGNNMIGKKFPTSRLTLRNGQQKDYRPEKEYTLIEFGNPDCDNCRFAKTKISMAYDLEELVEEGKLEILFIVADAVPEEQSQLLEQFNTYPAYWTPAICYGGDDIYDIRATPSFYILNQKGEIVAKNLEVSNAIDTLREMIGNDKKKSKK